MKQVMVIRSDLDLGKGKIAVQVAHASLQAAERCRDRHPSLYKEWEEGGGKKVVLKIGSREELLRLYEKIKRKMPAALIKDAGLTQIPPGTVTCAGFGPWKDEELDRYTVELPLL
jgi:PTH2 family peptidyl-tRNA hydrolase